MIILMLLIAEAGCSQEKKAAQKTRRIGGGCEGCEAVLDYGDKNLNNVDTLPDFQERGPKLIISGTIYQSDGKTPAKDVILYVYHTDQAGRYTPLDGDTVTFGDGSRPMLLESIRSTRYVPRHIPARTLPHIFTLLFWNPEKMNIGSMSSSSTMIPS